MPLDPQARAHLDASAALGLAAPETIPIEQHRANGLTRKRQLGGPPPPVAKVEDRLVPGPDGDVPVQIYTPEGDGPFPILVYFHGGGWVAGCIETHENVARALAKLTPCITVSVEYRLSPEAPFPKGLEDCYAATVWAAERGAEIGGDPTRIAVGGDSAGGNLAGAVALLARDRGGPKIGFQLLVYPVAGADFDTRSYLDSAEGYGLTRAAMMYYWDCYVSGEEDRTNPLTSLVHADPTGLPPAMVITAEFDPLRDEGDAYAEKLKAAGVPVEHVSYPGMIHGFFNVGTLMQRGDEAVERAARAIARALSPAPTTA